MRVSARVLTVLFMIAGVLAACSPAPPTEKAALKRCQSLARDAMPEFVGNPRYRVNKTKVEQLKSGPQQFEFKIAGEYFFKALNSGDSELRFECTISKDLADEEWTTGAFNSICVGGCYWSQLNRQPVATCCGRSQAFCRPAAVGPRNVPCFAHLRGMRHYWPALGRHASRGPWPALRLSRHHR